MAWRDQYQQGSFRGATFRTEYHERSGGRRVAVHEFPGRDDPEVEDLGRRARRFSIDCHVIGTAYTSARDALIEALETSGPGLLVHPFHGRMLASVLDYRSTEDTEEGGLCRFSIEFVEAGQPTSAPVAIANGNSSADQAEFVLAVAPAQFAAKFTVKNAAAFVEDAATGLVDGMAGAAQTAAALRGGAGPTLRAFEAGLRFLPDNISGLMRSPIDLGLALVGLVQAVSVLGSGVGRSQKLASLQLMLDWESEAPVFPVRTPQRTREAENRIALLQLFHVAGAAELVRAAGSARYA
ncbi:MAG: DNA circularization N-terminal domain-containing protein, partial [Betaproteobacteria bacterium]|nr:DNA circularization N-terminal domain-containing protein [Betaproteobacteria bacterium]